MLRRAIAMSAAVLLLGCDSTESSAVAGAWVATTWTITESGGSPTNVLAGGGTLSITIAGNNSTSGTIFLPATLAGDDQDFTASMAGTAVVSGSTVIFEQAADSFVRDVTWNIVGNTLVGAGVFAGTTVNVTLTRQ